MQATILAVGDEILCGQTTDTNSGWIARELLAEGVEVSGIYISPDNFERIFAELERAHSSSRIVLITGGLGPTSDDLTKDVLVKFFGSKLVMNEDVLGHLKAFFKTKGRQLLDANLIQSMLPNNCIPIPNLLGTAPGMWFHTKGKVVVSLPGVPHEMKPMFRNFVIPHLLQTFKFPMILQKHIHTAGLPESILSEKLKVVEKELPENIQIAYLPALRKVSLRLTATGRDPEVLESQLNGVAGEIIGLVGKNIYSFEKEGSLEKAIGRLLETDHSTITLAESCTGGLLAHKITSVPGSSAYFRGSLVAYSNEIKKQELNVGPDTLERFGAVSEMTVKEMVGGVMDKFNSTYGIAISGIAGPAGGTAEKPVGTVWIAVAGKNRLSTKKFHFTGTRGMIIELSATEALIQLYRILMDDG